MKEKITFTISEDSLQRLISIFNEKQKKFNLPIVTPKYENVNIGLWNVKEQRWFWYPMSKSMLVETLIQYI